MLRKCPAVSVPGRVATTNGPRERDDAGDANCWNGPSESGRHPRKQHQCRLPFSSKKASCHTIGKFVPA
ncbi:Hypothetical predicted protein, partial [Cloeon dipterum]